MSEQYSPKSFDDGDSDYRQFKDMQYRDELLGGAEQGSVRYEEAKVYDEHLKALKDKEGRTDDDVYNEATKQPDAVDRAIAAGNPQVRFMKALAEQIATLRNKAVDADRADRDVQALKDKEDSFNDRLADYENSEDADPSVIDRLMELATAEQAAAADNSGETGEQTTTPETEAEKPEADVDYKDMTDEQKAEFLKDVKGLVYDNIGDAYRFGDKEAFAEQVKKLRDSLMRDGGIELNEADQVVHQALTETYEGIFDSNETPADKPDSDADNAASDELLEELQMTPEERKNRDLLNIYRNASEDERRRINEIAWGENLENPLEGYDPEIARNISDDDAIELMRNAFENGYKLPIDAAADSDAEPQDDDSDAEQDSSDDEAEQQDAPTGFLNRLRSRWDNMENRRKKVTRAIGGIVLTAAGITMAVLIAKNGGDHSAALDAANNLQSTGIKPSEHANDPQAFANFAGSLKDLHVGAGQGVYDVLAHNGIDKSKVSYAELYDLQRQFPKELYLQQVGNVTDVRITSPGNLSQPLADALAKLARN